MLSNHAYLTNREGVCGDYSDHIEDDSGKCWCNPDVEKIDDILVVVHDTTISRKEVDTVEDD